MTDRKANLCAHCREPHGQSVAYVNRARKEGRKLYCDRRCFGLHRRNGKTKAQRVAEKRLYDMKYRRKNLALVKAKKAAYHLRTYDPVAAAVERKKPENRRKHRALIALPKHRAKKSIYDSKRRATNVHARVGLPLWAPRSVAESIDLLRQLRKVQREHQRA